MTKRKKQLKPKPHCTACNGPHPQCPDAGSIYKEAAKLRDIHPSERHPQGFPPCDADVTQVTHSVHQKGYPLWVAKEF